MPGPRHNHNKVRTEPAITSDNSKDMGKFYLWRILILGNWLFFMAVIPLWSQTPPELDDLPHIPAPSTAAEKRLYRSMLEPNRNSTRSAKSSRQTQSQTRHSNIPGLSSQPLPGFYKSQSHSTNKVPSKSKSLDLIPIDQHGVAPASVHSSTGSQSRHSKQPAYSQNVYNHQRSLNKARHNKVKKINFEIKKEKNTKKKIPRTIHEASRVKQHRPEPRRSRKDKDWRDILKHTHAVPGLPNSLRPTPRGAFRYYAPEFYRGIYLNNAVVRKKSRYKRMLKKAREYKVNVLVVDVQPRLPPKEFIKQARESGFYLVARVVVFPGGLKSYPPPMASIKRIVNRAEEAAKAGFMEIQLDYIRFTDYWKGPKLSLSQRYRVVTGVIKFATDQLRPHGVRIGADIFGRISFNKHDKIGQKLEVFAPHLDTIYPMLYPSHFYGQLAMRKYPYKPVFQGTQKAVKRVGHQSRIIAYIQAFKISVATSGLSYVEYIYKQLAATKDAGGAGFIAWNAGNHYSAFYRALKKFDQKAARATSSKVAPVKTKHNE